MRPAVRRRFTRHLGPATPRAAGRHARSVAGGRRQPDSCGGLDGAALAENYKNPETKTMQQVTANEFNGLPMPPGVTPITDLKNQKRANKTLSKAVGLHLEGKLEMAARLLAKALEDGER